MTKWRERRRCRRHPLTRAMEDLRKANKKADCRCHNNKNKKKNNVGKEKGIGPPRQSVSCYRIGKGLRMALPHRTNRTNENEHCNDVESKEEEERVATQHNAPPRRSLLPTMQQPQPEQQRQL